MKRKRDWLKAEKIMLFELFLTRWKSGCFLDVMEMLWRMVSVQKRGTIAPVIIKLVSSRSTHLKAGYYHLSIATGLTDSSESFMDWPHNRAKAISQANKRFMEVLLIVLGTTTDVTTITKQDIKQVLEVVENLPKRVV